MTEQPLDLDKRIENILHDKLAHFLSDIDFRIQQAYDVVGRAGGRVGKVFAEDLHLVGRHMLTGYTITNNSPSAGSIAWADLHVVYNGTDTVVANGNTAKRFVWWSPTTTPTVLQSSDTKPVLAAGEVLLFVNTGGAAKVMLSDTNSSLPSVLSDGAVDSGAIIAKAVGTTQLNDNAVTSGQLAGNAVVAGKIANGAINASAQIANNVVDTAQIKDSAIATGKLAGNAVDSTKLADGAVSTAAKLGSNVVTDAKILDGAVKTAKLDNNAVDSTKLKDGAVSTAAKLADGIVTTGKVATGAVDATKLNVMRHFLF